MRWALVVVAGLVIIAAIVFISLTSAPEVRRLHVLLVSNELIVDSLRREDLVIQLHKWLTEAIPKVVEIELYAPEGVSKRMHAKFQRGYVEGKQTWSRELLDSLRAFFTFEKVVIPSTEEVNALIGAFFRKVATDKRSTIVLAGSLPACYGQTDVARLLEKLQEMPRRKGQVLLSGLMGVRSEVEKYLLDSLQGILQMNVQPLPLSYIGERVCPGTEGMLAYGMFLDRLSDSEIPMLINFVQGVLGKQFRLVVWNDGPVNGTLISWSAAPDSAALYSTLGGLRRATWQSLSMLFTQCLEALRNDTSKLTRYVFIIGHFPSYPRYVYDRGRYEVEPILPKELWTELATIERVQFVHVLLHKRATSLDREYVAVLRGDAKLPIVTSYTY